MQWFARIYISIKLIKNNQLFTFRNRDNPKYIMQNKFKKCLFSTLDFIIINFLCVILIALSLCLILNKGYINGK